MNERYSDMHNVVESLEEHIGLNGGDEGEIVVCDFGQAKVVAESYKAVESKRNLVSDFDELIDRQVCKIEWKETYFDFGDTHLTLEIHESEVSNAFEFRPAGPDAIAPDQATDPRNLGPRLADALHEMAGAHDAVFTFKGVEAESMASGGHFTDFVFRYAIDGLGL